MKAKSRPLVVGEDGATLGKNSLHSAWRRRIHRAIKNKVITVDERFGLHDPKRKGITDTDGIGADKKEASGHKSAAMMDLHDLNAPVVQPSVKG